MEKSYFEEFNFKNQRKNKAFIGDFGKVIGFEQIPYRDGWRTYYGVRNGDSSKEFVIEETGLKNSAKKMAKGGNISSMLRNRRGM